VSVDNAGEARPLTFTSPDEVKARLLARDYLADPAAADAVYLAASLGRPLLIEGPAGVGKTELARTTAAATGARLIRLQCYEGLDETKALYEWDYRRQLLWLQAANHPSAAMADAGATGPAADDSWRTTSAALFSEEFLLPRPLLAAVLADEPVVLLVDEVDRMEIETEALLLEVLADFAVTVPEIGTLRARSQPLVFLTCNGTREMSEALRRRCLFLPMGYPDVAREADILRMRVPNLDAHLAAQVARVVHAIRQLDLRKPPSLSEAVDWARALRLFGVTDLAGADIARTLTALLKREADMVTVRRELDLGSV
jgi:MoxR-like ATPase